MKNWDKMMRSARAAAVCGLFILTVTAASVSGCSKRYEEITLPAQENLAGADGAADGAQGERGMPGAAGTADGNGSQRDGSQRNGSRGDGVQGDGVQGDNSQGDSSQGISAQEDGSLGNGSGGSDVKPRSIVLTDESEEASGGVGAAAAEAEAADGPAVAGTSPLEGAITTDNGFTDVDEIVYINDDLVNIRTGCGTDFSIVTQLNKGDSLKRTGYSDGWSRVLYKGKTCYVMSDYVSAEDPAGAESESVKALTGGTAAADGEAGLSGSMVRAAGADSGNVAKNGHTVAIDAGHQAKGNSDKEPVGPGSSTMKAKVASGTEGVSTKLPEYKLTLQVSLKLKRILEERGYRVVMIRESNDVNLSNAERAELANKSGASVFVRIHANSLDNSKIRGTLSMCQTEKNPYNGELHGKSYSLSKKITDSVCAATGFKNRGVQETDTMSGINWSKIPVSIVEMGFMSNPEEDELMAQDEYQEKIAAGIADGLDAYFGG